MKKKLVLGVTSLVVASAVAIGGTLAYLTAPTQEMTNTFKVIGQNVSGQIREKAWDGYDFNQYVYPWGQVNPDGSHAITPPWQPADPTLGINKAQAITPNMTIPKDPTLKNTSLIPVYMAIKVTYSDQAYHAFKDPVDAGNVALDHTKAPVASLDFNKGWKLYNGDSGKNSEIYFYVNSGTVKAPADGNAVTAVKPQDVTNPLFNNVHVNANIDFNALKAYIDPRTNTPNAFNVKVTGAAVQTSDIKTDEAQKLLVQALTK